MTVDQLKSRQGLAPTSFGQHLSVGEAVKLADEAAVSLLVRDAKGAVLNHGRTRRIATRTQTLALIARDKGCSFPGCDKPPDGANATISSPGPTAVRRILKISPWFVGTTTANSTAPAGPVR